MSIKGKIHTLESFGAADGPGVRFVVFLKGCNMRCKYCHNPDTWAGTVYEEWTAEDLLKRVLRCKDYWGENGGITVSGGEPLLQMEFVTEFFRLAKEQGIHTALDTSGNPFTKAEPFFLRFNELMKYTDLVILDIKEIDSERHKAVTGKDNANILEMAEYLSEINMPVWIRYVLVPEYTDFDEDLNRLKCFTDKLSNVERIEVLPYHTLGVFKWENLGMKYELDGISPPSEERIKNACKVLDTKKYR